MNEIDERAFFKKINKEEVGRRNTMYLRNTSCFRVILVRSIRIKLYQFSCFCNTQLSKPFDFHPCCHPLLKIVLFSLHWLWLFPLFFNLTLTLTPRYTGGGSTCHHCLIVYHSRRVDDIIHHFNVLLTAGLNQTT